MSINVVNEIKNRFKKFKDMNIGDESINRIATGIEKIPNWDYNNLEFLAIAYFIVINNDLKIEDDAIITEDEEIENIEALEQYNEFIAALIENNKPVSDLQKARLKIELVRYIIHVLYNLKRIE